MATDLDTATSASPTLRPDAHTQATLDMLMGRYFSAISFGERLPPAFERLDALFMPGAQVIDATGAGDPIAHRVDTLAALRRGSIERRGLRRSRDSELWQDTAVFGRVAVRLSGTETHGADAHGPFCVRGLLTTQFVRTTAGWRISAMARDDERPGFVLPG